MLLFFRIKKVSSQYYKILNTFQFQRSHVYLLNHFFQTYSSSKVNKVILFQRLIFWVKITYLVKTPYIKNIAIKQNKIIKYPRISETGWHHGTYVLCACNSYLTGIKHLPWAKGLQYLCFSKITHLHNSDICVLDWIRLIRSE